MRFYYATGTADQNGLQYLGNFKTFGEAETELYRLTKDLGVLAAYLYVPACHFSIFAESCAGQSRFRLVRVLHFTKGTATVITKEDAAKKIQVDIRILRKAS